jgi:hypothetical protein
MRRPLRHKAVTIIAAIISFTAIPAAGIVATATPALATIGVHICLRSGNGCVGAPTINIGDPVELTATGRYIVEVPAGFTCCGGHEVFRLQFSADATKCVGVPDGSLSTTVRACSGGNNSNVNWAEEPQGDGSIKWFSNTKNGFLSSDNRQGDQLFVGSNGCNGCFQRWNN